MEPEFVNYTSTLSDKSRKLYIKRATEYKQFCAERELDTGNIQSVNQYVDLLRSEEYDLAATTIWNVTSMIGSWFEAVHNIHLFAANGMLKKKLKQWEKQDEVKKSEVFTQTELNDYLHRAPNDDNHLWRKCAMILAVYGFSRKTELTNIHFKDVRFSADNRALIVEVSRLKSNGAKETSSFAVTDELCVNIVRNYMSCFDREERTGRFFRSLKNGKATKQPVGVNTLAKVPNHIAMFLGKPNADAFTSHCFRRTAATLLAESGASLPLMKIAGGWKSSTVAENYIAKSELTKRKISDRISLGKSAEDDEENDEPPNKRSNTASTSSQAHGPEQSVTLNNSGQHCVFHFNFHAPTTVAEHHTGGGTGSPLVLRLPKHATGGI